VHEIEATFYENNRNDAEGFAESMEFFFNKFLKDYPEKQFYFNWSRETYKKRRRGFLKFVAEYIKSNRNAYASAIAEEAAELLSETSRTN
jgi:acyl-CoA reductase-like NAD-dependent aldehyde dehydrogenase